MNMTADEFQHIQELLSANAHGTPAFAAGLEQLQEFAAANNIEAQLALGHLYAQVQLLADAPAQAARWYRLAAERDHPVAQDRMADLYMLGYGVPQNDAEALRWYALTAAQAYPHALCNLAYMYTEGLGTQPDAHAAARFYLRALALADARGLFNFGLLCATSPNPTLWPAAHACLALATYAQYPLAAEEQTLLDARSDAVTREAGTTLTEQLRLRLRSFQQRCKSDASLATDPTALEKFAEDNLTALGEPFMPAAIASVSAVQPHRPDAQNDISAAPRIFTVDNFVSTSECAHLMALADARFAPAREATRERLSGEQTAFSGATAVFHVPDGDAVIRNLERRIAQTFDLPASHVEPISVLRYRHDDRYAPHVDYFDAVRLANNVRNGDRAGQRVASFLVYLRAPEAGGATHYLKIGKKIVGYARMALCHFNLDTAKQPDSMTLHTGEAVQRGEKWLARTTLREKPFF